MLFIISTLRRTNMLHVKVKFIVFMRRGHINLKNEMKENTISYNILKFNIISWNNRRDVCCLKSTFENARNIVYNMHTETH